MDSGAERVKQFPVQEITIAPIPRDILAREFQSRTGAAPGLRYQDVGGNASKLFNLPLKDTTAAAAE